VGARDFIRVQYFGELLRSICYVFVWSISDRLPRYVTTDEMNLMPEVLVNAIRFKDIRLTNGFALGT